MIYFLFGLALTSRIHRTCCLFERFEMYCSDLCAKYAAERVAQYASQCAGMLVCEKSLRYSTEDCCDRSW